MTYNTGLKYAVIEIENINQHTFLQQLIVIYHL